MRCGQTSVRFACCVLMQIKPGFTTLPREPLLHSTRWQILLCDLNNAEIELNFEARTRSLPECSGAPLHAALSFRAALEYASASVDAARIGHSVHLGRLRTMHWGPDNVLLLAGHFR
jgi:hypothetical protein